MKFIDFLSESERKRAKLYLKKSKHSFTKKKRELYHQQYLDLLELAAHRAKDYLLEKGAGKNGTDQNGGEE